ncbi:hypothetical protein BpHYR1_044530 [Brachionus plicatilis]|uniref:Uncharacterized protein n=1 Tax=Brachionus plicatilis TaxID=10195 RepID=A0A3M7SZ59_BRAPC|nr:hypothetical protein BpHYR1_044530 [Brachionus plicatilis]
MSVEDISYRTTVRSIRTLIIQQAFDGILELFLAIDEVEEQCGPTLTKARTMSLQTYTLTV